MKKILIYSVLCLIAALPVSAQKFYKDAINITNASLWQQGESLYINMQMDMRNLKVSNDRTLTLTPVLTGTDNNVVLPEIVINGRRRQKAYLRAMALDKATNMEIPYNTQEVLNYTQVIPYEPWMEKCLSESGRRFMRMRRTPGGTDTGNDYERSFYGDQTSGCTATCPLLHSAESRSSKST